MLASVEWSQVKTRVNKWKSCPERYFYEYTADRAFASLVVTERVESWNDFLDWSGKLQGWGFRGQRETVWALQTSLERIARVNYSRGNISGSFPLPRRAEERELLLRFQQQAPDHISQLPSGDDIASWFALMQHLGVPTRFLDWTLSPSIAMYFALEEEPQEQEKLSAVWAIDLEWLEMKASELLGQIPDEPNARIEYLKAVLSEQKEPVIVRIDPQYPNQRLLIQKGLFLWKLFEETPLFDPILASMMIHPAMPERPVIKKLEVGEDLRIEFLQNLRAMDIHRDSLFPESADFCKPLKRSLETKVADEVARAEQWAPEPL